MIITLKIYNWAGKRVLKSDEEVETGKNYIIQNNFGQFIGKIVNVKQEKTTPKSDLEISDVTDETKIKTNYSNGMNGDEYLKIIKKASEKDLKKSQSFKDKEQEIQQICRDKVKQYQLPMKLVGVTQSLDSSSVIIAFISENRVDFRELVRDLARTLQKAVRLEQIGSRDEARIRGGFGLCGRELCCIKFNGPLKSINTDMARVQQITHRGSERISGCCGRLICCLAYELEHYEKLMKNMPQAGERVQVNGALGVIKTIKVLQRKVLVKFSNSQKSKNQIEEKWFDLKDIRAIKK
ncbi:MAG: regulatory iron-sulfur-containing complex subunit RicT [Patescibacteria group bacterium]|nr:stage 0 sporulation protein [Patescibacteria group bacterium]